MTDTKIEFTAKSMIITQAAGPTIILSREDISDAEWAYDTSSDTRTARRAEAYR